MAAQNKLFQRLIWLVDTIYSAGHISLEDIDRRWQYSPYNDNHSTEYGERNFHRHRDTIYELFGIRIVCNRLTHTYSLANLGDMQKDGIRAWLIDTFAVNNMVNLAGDMQNRIFFEHIPQGSRYLSTIVSAMKEEHKLNVTYKRFDRPDPHSFLLAPYCLKIFQRRWYLVGKPDDHPEEKQPRIYALDRVKEIIMTESKFRVPNDFDATTFFTDYFGIDRSLSNVEKIKIRTGSQTANFIRTLPLHDSQQEIERTSEYSVFTYYVVPTYDFIQELRKHGPYLEVLEPQSLRETFRKDTHETAKMYE